MALDLPANLVASMRRNPSPERQEWLAQLPDTLRELTERWSLRVGKPYQPGGECAWVAPVIVPEVIVCDQGSAFVSRAVRGNQRISGEEPRQRLDSGVTRIPG